MYILLCKDIELACDEKVTKDKEKKWKASYCEAILVCHRQRRSVGACLVAFCFRGIIDGGESNE